jgi:hypothetical protein
MGMVALWQLNRFVTIYLSEAWFADHSVACRPQITALLASHRFLQALIKYRFGTRGSVAIGIVAESQMIHCLKK